MSDYFIDNDAHGDPWVWAKNGDRPTQVLNLLHIAPEYAPLFDLIRAAVEGEVREEWGVRDEDGRMDGAYIKREHARAFADAYGPNYIVFRRTVITGAWEEER